MGPVLHRKFNLFLIFHNVVGEVDHLLFGIFAELVHDEPLLKVTLIEVVLDEDDRLFAVILSQLKHVVLDG